MSALGDRMKANYESRFRYMLIRRMPVIVRVDGKAFHSFCRVLEKPFDDRFITTMVNAAKSVSEDMQGFKAAYIQSDEASFLLTDYDQLNTEAWFGYNKSKVESISASAMTAYFNSFWYSDRLAMFDARAFNVPREEVANYFLWRMRDWNRNSLSMYCRQFYSEKQMIGKNKAEQHDMLFAKGANWTTDLSERKRNGVWIVGSSINTYIIPNYADIDEIIRGMIYKDDQ